jgi:hypothetical protein
MEAAGFYGTVVTTYKPHGVTTQNINPIFTVLKIPNLILLNYLLATVPIISHRPKCNQLHGRVLGKVSSRHIYCNVHLDYLPTVLSCIKM